MRALLVLLTSLLVFAALAEPALRLYSSRRIVYDVEMARYANLLKMPSENPRIGHVHRPGASARLMGVEVRINSDGLRDDEVPRARSGARRVIFLGDSLTFGWGVHKPDAFEARIERALASETPSEVVNFGTGNYNTVQQVELFLEKGLAYDPDAVVVFYFINDAEPVPKRSRLWWLSYSRLFTFYWSRMRALTSRWSGSADFASYYANLYREDAPGWSAAREAFLDLKRACEENGIALRVVLLPELHSTRDYLFADEHARVSRFLAEKGIAALDLAPRFAEESDPRALWVAHDDAHPNARAHGLIARHSLPFVREALDADR